MTSPTASTSTLSSSSIHTPTPAPVAGPSTVRVPVRAPSSPPSCWVSKEPIWFSIYTVRQTRAWNSILDIGSLGFLASATQAQRLPPTRSLFLSPNPRLNSPVFPDLYMNAAQAITWVWEFTECQIVIKQLADRLSDCWFGGLPQLITDKSTRVAALHWTLTLVETLDFLTRVLQLYESFHGRSYILPAEPALRAMFQFSDRPKPASRSPHWQQIRALVIQILYRVYPESEWRNFVLEVMPRDDRPLYVTVPFRKLLTAILLDYWKPIINGTQSQSASVFELRHGPRFALPLTQYVGERSTPASHSIFYIDGSVPEPQLAQIQEPQATQPQEPQATQPQEPQPAQPQEPQPTQPQEPQPTDPQETQPAQAPEPQHDPMDIDIEDVLDSQVWDRTILLNRSPPADVLPAANAQVAPSPATRAAAEEALKHILTPPVASSTSITDSATRELIEASLPLEDQLPPIELEQPRSLLGTLSDARSGEGPQLGLDSLGLNLLGLGEFAEAKDAVVGSSRSSESSEDSNEAAEVSLMLTTGRLSTAAGSDRSLSPGSIANSPGEDRTEKMALHNASPSQSPIAPLISEHDSAELLTDPSPVPSPLQDGRVIHSSEADEAQAQAQHKLPSPLPSTPLSPNNANWFEKLLNRFVSTTPSPGPSKSRLDDARMEKASLVETQSCAEKMSAWRKGLGESQWSDLEFLRSASNLPIVVEPLLAKPGLPSSEGRAEAVARPDGLHQTSPSQTPTRAASPGQHHTSPSRSALVIPSVTTSEPEPLAQPQTCSSPPRAQLVVVPGPASPSPPSGQLLAAPGLVSPAQPVVGPTPEPLGQLRTSPSPVRTEVVGGTESELGAQSETSPRPSPTPGPSPARRQASTLRASPKRAELLDGFPQLSPIRPLETSTPLSPPRTLLTAELQSEAPSRPARTETGDGSPRAPLVQSPTSPGPSPARCQLPSGPCSEATHTSASPSAVREASRSSDMAPEGPKRAARSLVQGPAALGGRGDSDELAAVPIRTIAAQPQPASSKKAPELPDPAPEASRRTVRMRVRRDVTDRCAPARERPVRTRASTTVNTASRDTKAGAGTPEPAASQPVARGAVEEVLAGTRRNRKRTWSGQAAPVEPSGAAEVSNGGRRKRVRPQGRTHEGEEAGIGEEGRTLQGTSLGRGRKAGVAASGLGRTTRRTAGSGGISKQQEKPKVEAVDSKSVGRKRTWSGASKLRAQDEEAAGEQEEQEENSSTGRKRSRRAGARRRGPGEEERVEAEQDEQVQGSSTGRKQMRSGGARQRGREQQVKVKEEEDELKPQPEVVPAMEARRKRRAVGAPSGEQPSTLTAPGGSSRPRLTRRAAKGRGNVVVKEEDLPTAVSQVALAADAHPLRTRSRRHVPVPEVAVAEAPVVPERRSTRTRKGRT